MTWISVASARKAEWLGKAVEVRGWVRTRRDSKAGISFIEVNDGSCLGNLQVVAETSLFDSAEELARLGSGSAVVVFGMIVASPAPGQATELQAKLIRLVGWADPEHYPLQKKRHSLEKLREWGHLRGRTNTMGAVMRLRNQLSKSIHSFFQERGFVYLHTPIITASDCEGAGKMFQVTTLNRGQDRGSPAVDGRVDFFGKPTFLTVSGQLEGEAYALALSKIYTFGPTFRAENSNTSRHLSEFWMIEPEMAFYDLLDNMRLAEEFLKQIVRDVLDSCQEDLAFFDQHIQAGVSDRLSSLASQPFNHMTYSDAVQVLQKSGVSFDFPVAWGVDLQSEHERFLTEKYVGGPLILTDYPATIKSFYMRSNDDDRTVAAMDVLVPGVGEIIGGSQREERLDVLKTRMAEQGLDEADYWWYLDLRRFGSAPHSGFGLGLDRMVLYASGMSNIRDVVPFPRFPGSAEF